VVSLLVIGIMLSRWNQCRTQSVSIKQSHLTGVVNHGHCSPQFCEQGAATPWRDHLTNYDTSETGENGIVL